MPQLPLHLLRFELQTTTELHFPPEDGGFKASAWHGRIDNQFATRPDLAHLRSGRRPGDPAAYWWQAPEERSDAADGPFGLAAYPPGHRFDGAVYLVHPSPAPDLISSITQAIRAAGTASPKPTDPLPKRQGRLLGSFSARFIGMRPYHPTDEAPPASKLAVLHVSFDSMLRLDDGPMLQAAMQALERGEQLAPALNLLTSRVIERARLLGLGQAPWLLPALQNSQSAVEAAAASTHVAQCQVWPFGLTRTSAHAQRSNPLGGLLGSISYIGPTDALYAAHTMLHLAQWIRLGRKSGLGAGRVSVSLGPA